jgi:hypothetical protein
MNRNTLLLGAIAGGAATGPMTVTMNALQRRLPRWERYPLPPREIIDKLSQETKTAEIFGEATHRKATLGCALRIRRRGRDSICRIG